MALEPGGYADKLGNYYEERWIAKQLLRLLNEEEVNSVTIEAIGPDNQGVDIFILDKNNIKHFQQCKSRNASRQYWSISDLHSAGILKNMKFQLDRSGINRFVLVTGIPATNFSDICQSARNSNANPEDYYIYQIVNIGRERQDIFSQYCKCLDLEPSSESDRAKAFDYLRRIEIYLWADDDNTCEEVISQARYYVTGDPKTVVSLLIQYAKENLRKTIIAADISKYLSGKGFHQRILSHDPRVLSAVEKIKDVFKESIRPRLIDDTIIPRTETDQVLESIINGNNVIVYGQAGTGKSGVLYELTQKLNVKNIQYLPVRLDRQVPQNTPLEYGKSIGLPESPVKCLEASGSGKPSVLILDQLDALRWTSSHSPNSLEVCKSLVREANWLKLEGKPISVILSCRKYDLENDPELKKWLQKDKSFQKIEVKGLLDSSLKPILKKYNVDIEKLTSRQKNVLSVPQHLEMWVSLKQSDKSPSFQTSTQLMRQFWAEKRRELESKDIQPSEIENILSTIIDSMESSGELTASSRLIEKHQKLATELKTLGIIQDIENNRIMFCHQSYLDYLIANRLVDEINKNQKNILQWLGPKENQSLFRREQLRQVLNLLRDDDIGLFEATVRIILSEESVRFHIKQLTLGVLGQIENPKESLCNYIIQMIGISFWTEHFIWDVCNGNPCFVRFLIEKGIIWQWLVSQEEIKIMHAVILLRSVNNKIGDIVADILDRYIKKGGTIENILSIMSHQIEEDNDKLFGIRLLLAKKNIVPTYIGWKSFCNSHPQRVIPLIDTFLSSWESPKSPIQSKPGQYSRFEEIGNEESKALIKVACCYPEQAFNCFFNHIVRLTNFKPEQHDHILDDWQNTYHFSSYHEGIPFAYGVVQCVIEAGKIVIEKQPEFILTSIKSVIESSSQVIQQIIADILTALPKKPEYADQGIQWLISDPSHIVIGTGYYETEWEPARRLIEALSPCCSNEIFSKLEKYIINYHSPTEKRDAEYWLKTWKEGYYGYFWGAAQYFLLPALSKNRRSQSTDGLIGVLNRRYEKHKKSYFIQDMSGAYCVGSPIKEPCKLSDKAWRGIMANEKIPLDHARSVRTGPDSAVESTIRQFSDSLRIASARQPQRFAELALTLPLDTHSDYIGSILDGIKTITPSNISEEEKKTWQPANIVTIIQVLERFMLARDSDFATEFCRVIRDRSKELFPVSIINKLIDYAKNHPDPHSQKMNVYSSDKGDNVANATINDLFTNSLNCTRGEAAYALGALLREHPEDNEILLSGIKVCIEDPHPSVRMAAVNSCLPLLNTAPELALTLFLRACRNDLRVAAFRYAVYYFNTCFQTHTGLLKPIIIEMLNSDLPEVAEEGAKEVCARWVFHGEFNDEIDLCLKGSIAQKKGAAEVLSHLSKSGEYTNKVRPYLSILLNDDNADVRQKASSAFFRTPDIFELPDLKLFLIEYIRSKAFMEHSDGLIYSLEEYSGLLTSLSEIIFEICDVFAGSMQSLSQDARSRYYWKMSEISPLLFRLYEQSEHNPEIRNRCLDSWDKLFEKRVGYVMDMIKKIDDVL